MDCLDSFNIYSESLDNQSISIKDDDLSYPNYREEIFPEGMDDPWDEIVDHNSGIMFASLRDN